MYNSFRQKNVAVTHTCVFEKTTGCILTLKSFNNLYYIGVCVCMCVNDTLKQFLLLQKNLNIYNILYKSNMKNIIEYTLLFKKK